MADAGAAVAVPDLLSRRFGLSMSRFAAVRDLFAPEHPQGAFGLWYSLIFRSGRRPDFKLYANPEIRGVEHAPDLVEEALRRLGLGTAFRTVLDRAVRPGELGRVDRLAYFALDLGDGPHARIKLYLSHDGAEARDAVRAAGAVEGVAGEECAAFCATVGGRSGAFDGRPLVDSYTFFEGVDAPVGYSLYIPVRSYVRDDAEARARAVAALEWHGFGGEDLDQAIRAVTSRPLEAGVGLIAHAALRLGQPRPGMTVYLSTEAYRVGRPRRRGPGAPAHERGDPTGGRAH
jgi:DMATS type aromatic prenyltransferase